MSALAEKIKSLMTTHDYTEKIIEILLELEARQPYTIQVFPNPGSFPAAGPVYPFISPTPYPSPSFPRIGEPTWPNTTICHNNNSNGPEPQSDPTGYVEPVGRKPVGYGG